MSMDGGGTAMKSMESFLVMCAVGSQGLSMCMGAYFITDVIQKKGDELAKPRPEHAPVEALSKAMARREQVYKDVTAWARMTTWQKGLISSSCCCFIGSFWVFFYFTR